MSESDWYVCTGNGGRDDVLTQQIHAVVDAACALNDTTVHMVGNTVRNYECVGHQRMIALFQALYDYTVPPFLRDLRAAGDGPSTTQIHDR